METSIKDVKLFILMLIFLTSGNRKVGFGHLRRCQYLKDELEKKKIKCYFYKYNRNNCTLENNIKLNVDVNNGRINLSKLKKIILRKKIRVVVLDDYRYKEKHRKFLSKLGCLIIQLNYFYDNDNYIDLCINHLKRKTNKLYLINSLNNVIVSPYKNLKIKKKKIIIVYFSNPEKKILAKIKEIINFNFKNYKIFFISNQKKLFLPSVKLNKKIKLLNLRNNIERYFAISEFLISSGGLTCIEASRYKVKNIVINLNKKNLINSKYLLKKKIIHKVLSKNFTSQKLSKVISDLKQTKINKTINFQSTQNTAKKISEYIRKYRNNYLVRENI